MAEHCLRCKKVGTWYARATDIEYFTTPRTFDYYHCQDCDILFIAPMLSDQLSTIYPPSYYAFDEKSQATIAWKVKRWLDKRLMRGVTSRIRGADNLSILDIGGGTGWMAAAARTADSRVARTLVVDMDPQAETRARSGGHDFYCGRIEDFASKEKFDLILMLNLIEHVPDPDQIIRASAKLLSPRGRILIQTPNFRSLDAFLFRYRSWGGYHCPRHFVLFSKSSLSQLLVRNELAVEKIRYTQGAAFWATSIMHELAQRGIISAGPNRYYHMHPASPILQIFFAAFDFIRRPFSKTSQMVVVAKHKDQ